MRTLVSIPVSIIVLNICVPVFAQQSRPAPELERENRELKEYIERLEKRLSELNEHEREWQKAQPFRIPPASPAPRAPYRFERPEPLPQPPRADPFIWPPRPPRVIPTPPPGRSQAPSPPPNSYHFRFNGQDVYVIPLQSRPQ